ncbi:cilia- and flagella-associated protein 47 isoform X1 [Zootoca vivipara]|uniref:cilia- and flagella-associated protein 47 isoform X1 n=1 Tax=Zootoca vivipara TaxID=8524 RepID=UPI00293BBDFF|nr:cilia- and flagella-associated protein 47 isoform X1 [Zootoca vivipara]
MEPPAASWHVAGVRITPPEVCFLDAVPGRRYRALLSIQNLQSHSCLLRLMPPERPQFKLIVENQKNSVASGLHITAIVEYHPDKDINLQDRLLLHIGKQIVEIPLIGLIPCCCLEIEPEIDFGTLIADSNVINKNLKITNYGSSPGTFAIKYKGNVSISIAPTSGVVEPQSEQLINMEICTDVPRTINETAIVKLQGRPKAQILIKANIVEQVLELLGMPPSNKIKCVNFGCVYFGTTKTEEVVLHNKSPEPMDWVAILQDNAVGGEMGTDIQKSTNAVLKDLNHTDGKAEQDVCTLIACIPNEGTLQPDQKMMISICFSPKMVKRDRGDLCKTPPRQDYALFLKFEAIRSKNDFLEAVAGGDRPTDEKNRHQVELALIGSGLPVILTFKPGPVVNFVECYMGEHTDIVCTLKNECDILPVSFAFRKIAHYNICPEKGKVKAKSTQDILFSFIPRHVGTFTMKQVIDIIGPVAKKDGLPALEIKPFHQTYLIFSGVCNSVTNKVVLKPNLGITPQITNEVGVFVARKAEQTTDVAPVALLKSDRTLMHAHRIKKKLSNALVAFPNDRQASIRPAELQKDYRTIFTKVARYSYLDPEFSYTLFEELEKQVNKDYYASYLQSLRQRRLHKKAARIFKSLNNPVDIGLKPASGLKSPSFKILQEEKLEEEVACVRSSLLTSQQLAEMESKTSAREVGDGLNPVPTLPQEIEDCSLILTPKQLHQIFIGPSTIDFGEVYVGSTSTRKMHLVNNLPVHIWVQVEIESEELQQTSPLFHVIPPFTKTYIPVVLENKKLGNFRKSFVYSVNQHHTGHVLVVALVVPVALEISTREVTLSPAFSYLAETGFRTTVTLYNRGNCPAKFTWKPVITDEGMAFSICPEQGVVDACQGLECEVAWHPSFSAPTRGEFDLCVHQGKTLKLKCLAKLGTTSVQFKEKRITFNHAPLHLTTCKTAILQNVGHNHAYFQVIDANPLPGMIISPFQGVVPVGGHTEINIYFRPNALMKFDSRVEIAVRHAKYLELRVGGSVDVPDIYISMDSFCFPGVYVGSTQKIPFLIENKGKTRAKVTVDLSKHEDFELHFPLQSDATPDTSRFYTAIIKENSALDCSLSFTPKEVAAYDFSLPININVDEDESSLVTKKTNLSGSAKHIIVPRPQLLTIPTKVCKVQGTVLQPPLQVSPLEIIFQYCRRSLKLGVISDSSNIKKLHLNNVSKKQITWRFDLDAAGKAVDNGIFKFSLFTGVLYPGQSTVVTICFCPYSAGAYTAQVPVLLNEDVSVYRIVTLSGSMTSSKINFEPQLVILTPVPLNVETGVDVCIIPQNYLSSTVLQVEISESDSREDVHQIDPLTVDFPNGNVIQVTSEGTNIGFTCHVSFCSSKPVSFLKNVLFVDGEKNRFPLQVSATAENCLLTVYPYLASHLTNQQITLRSESNEIIYSTGETLQHPCYVPGSCSQISSGTFERITNSEDSFAELEKMLEMLKSESTYPTRRARSKFESLVFPDEGTVEYAFHEKVISAVQNWFTLFGWSKGPNPISVPHSLRRDVCKIQMASSDEKLRQNLGKDIRTIYDLLLHLSGQSLPGISSSQSLPCDPIQRVVQLHWQHSTMITFLRGQGACLPHILPQFLLDFEDYKKWACLQLMVKVGSFDSNDSYVYVLDDCLFEAMSKRAWTDVLLQIYKILVLHRVSIVEDDTESNSENFEHVPRISADPLSSNIYSSSERILLIWMNRNFEKTRTIVWKDSKKGDIPPTRWIVNFDKDLLDGLVLAAQVARYCPYLISTHFVNMYTNPQTSEECLHNCLILVNAFHAISLDIHVLATDICDPNPITMLMLCVYLYEWLPQYLPKKSVEFAGPLHGTVVRKIQLKNPSIKPLVYTATILGRECADFSLPKGNMVTIPPKSQTTINVEFTSRFLHPAEAVLLLITKALTGVVGATMAFSLMTKISRIKPAGVLKCKSPCYELNELNLHVISPFEMDGPFSIILVESTSCITEPENLDQLSHIKQDKTKIFESEILNKRHEVIGVRKICSQEDSSNTAEEFTSSDSVDEPPDDAVATKESNYLQEFFSPMAVVFLTGESSSILSLHYLPFTMGKRYCAIILFNEQIGEFVYLVEGTCDLPLPSGLLPMNSPNVLCISSVLEGDREIQPVLCLKCCVGNMLQEKLKIPLVNEAREKALALAAQQQMSALEYERRKVTGTLESSSVRVAVAALGLSQVEKDALHNSPKFSKKYIEYSVEVSMPEYFESPEKIEIPVLASSRVHPTHQGKERIWSAEEREVAEVELPIKFLPKYPGRYPCQILLQSKYDVRLFHIECVVNTNTAEAELEFVTPAYQAVTQDIPITNMSQQDWKLKAHLKGCCFYGPPLIYVAPGETTPYTLMFKPTSECVITGKLILQNEADGTEHVFVLKGIATKPLALDYLAIECRVREITQKLIMVPNFTNEELHYKVSSDIPIVSGDPILTVEPGDTAAYTLTVFPWKRGKFEGVIIFAAEDGEQQQKTDGVQIPQKLSGAPPKKGSAANTGQSPPYSKVWFSLEINCIPAAPEKTIHVECAVLDTVCIGIPVTNPTADILELEVELIDSVTLNGERSLVLQPKEAFHYEVKYSPAVTGDSDGSVVFQSEKHGEFWYALKLKAQRPRSQTLPIAECELGKWVHQHILLANPTYEILELNYMNSNSAHFIMEIDPEIPLVVAPHSTTEVPVRFFPSALGRANHTAKITFMCPQLEEWVFLLSGVGLIPQPLEPACVSSCLGHHSSIIISFRNPTFEDIVLDVFLTDKQHVMHNPPESVSHQPNKDSIFWLSLKQKQGIVLAPKSKLDIPVFFAPQSMKLYEVVLVIKVEKLDADKWSYDDTFDVTKALTSNTVIMKDEVIRGIRWIYPIHGIPESPPYKSAPAVVCCRARSRLDERIEVLLTGVTPATSGAHVVSDSIIIIPSKSKSVAINDEGFSTPEEFVYDIEFESDRVAFQLKSAVAINLLKKLWDLKTGIVTLIFNIIFAPSKPMRHPATLVVQCVTGGIWKFPILFVATEPEVDDVINIEAAGLNKESVVKFKLTSKTRYPEPYTAYFLTGSDPEFAVSPQAGELLPLDSTGTWITVGFKPNMYSKKHKATLVIQTTAMQWMYQINGLPPQTVPPSSSAKVDCRNTYVRSASVQQRNFVRENMKLLSTGVSSTIKGAPLILKAK